MVGPKSGSLFQICQCTVPLLLPHENASAEKVGLGVVRICPQLRRAPHEPDGVRDFWVSERSADEFDARGFGSLGNRGARQVPIKFEFGELPAQALEIQQARGAMDPGYRQARTVGAEAQAKRAQWSGQCEAG